MMMFSKYKEFLDQNKQKAKYDFLIVDFHGEITSEKMAIGHVFDGHATFVVGTHLTYPRTMQEFLIKELLI